MLDGKDFGLQRKNGMSDTTDLKEKREKKKLSVSIRLLIIGMSALIAAAAVYFAVAAFYRSRFLPGTQINGFLSGKMTAGEVSRMLEADAYTYQLKVTGRDGETLGILNAEDMGLTVSDTSEAVEHMLKEQNVFRWPMYAFGREEHEYHLLYVTGFEEEKVLQCVEGWEAFDEKGMKVPENARIGDYLPEEKCFEIIPETPGTVLDVRNAKERILSAVTGGETEIDLEKEGFYKKAEVTSKNVELLYLLDAMNRMVSARITYDWYGTSVILDGDTIREWIVTEEKTAAGIIRKVLLDEEAVAAYVKARAEENDTYGKSRNFVTALGKTVYLRNGGYGWKTDTEKETKELINLIKEGAVTEREPVAGIKAAQKGKDDIGTSYVEIDLTNQHLYVFEKGEIVLESDFVSGGVSAGNTTPGGLFGLTYKTTNAVLRGADYVTPVHYWMPFNGNIGMHDATWRAQFGGDIYLTNGSHGCINLPLDKAREIYGYVYTGSPIICYYYY